MIRAQSVALRRGTQLLFSDANFSLHAGQRVGITGANGCGKSSLLAVLCGEVEVDSGEISVPPEWAVAHVAQHTPSSDRSALDYAIDGDTALRQLQNEAQLAEQAHDGTRHASLLAELESAGAYTAEARAAQMLSGLGFRQEDLQRSLKEFSGGWRMRLNLAQALMCRSDLLLLDEPTNHLDLDAVVWLEQWLSRYEGTLLLISHDREFLDSVVGQILHFEHNKVALYTGNYSEFETQRAAHLANQQSAFEKQQREIAHMESFVTRFKAKATKAKQAQSRVKALERMTRITAAHVDSPFSFGFSTPKDLPERLLQLEKAQLGYGDKSILASVSLDLRAGDRIGLIGPNGAGKSTLIKALARELEPLSGDLHSHDKMTLGYFAQHQLEQLRLDRSPLQHLQDAFPAQTEAEHRSHLGRFGFVGDRVFEAVAPFSGGEKARLVLALLVRSAPNLLLLDEPTNHLDLEMRHALATALQAFEGAVVLISHDRHLLRVCCDKLLLVAQGSAVAYENDLDSYAQWLLQERKNSDTSAAVQQNKPDRREQRREQAQARAKLQPLRNRARQNERQMEKLQGQLAELEKQLADPALYESAQSTKLQEVIQQQAKVREELESTEMDWLAAMEAIEAAESAK
ncbi:MAG: ATP-binding cassette domain-containing protein [Granulosicoccaceae bacterium]